MTRSARWAVLLIVLFVAASTAAAVLVLISLPKFGFWQRDQALWIKVSGETPEQAASDFLDRALGRQTTDLRDMLDGLEQAAGDDKIKGLLLEIADPGLGWAQNEELRAAIERFRQSGKWSWAFLESAGEFAGGNGAFLLASTCDRILLAPPGDVGLTALRAETPFFRGLLDKLGVLPQLGQRKEFKNAANTYTEADYTPAHREATLELVDSLYTDMVAAVAKGRRVTAARAVELIASGPHTGPEALALGLVDELLYRDEALSRLEQQLGRRRPWIALADYLARGRPHQHGWRKIAVVYAVGEVRRGGSGGDPLLGRTMGADTLARALRSAREDRSVAAVVLRVDSPGGSYIASDVIRREVELTQQEKPVVASMGNVAASGGYFVAMHAGRIVADSATITGSIGVYGGKLVTRRLWEEKLGVRFAPLDRGGESAGFWSTQTEWDARGWQRMNAMLDRIYEDFTTKAARGREMPVEQLEPLAHGRVWSGKDAHKRRLVDQIGGLFDAVQLAREQAKLEPDQAFEIVILPEPPSLLRTLLDGGRDVALLPREVQQALRAAALLGADEERFLLNPELPVIR